MHHMTLGVLWLAITTAGCGDGTLLPRAQAPRIPGGEARCRAAALSESPLITEWSSAEKANLQARLASGGLVVQYSGCSMRPIPGCQLRGSYRWKRTTLSTDTLQIHNQDELFAKLPLGALALEGELARAGRLEVRTTVSGQYLLEGSTAGDVPDYGECASATHLLTALSVGSFKMISGGSLQMAGGAQSGLVETGASTASIENQLREAGDFEACKLATDEIPNIGCSSPIQAFLVPLPRFAQQRGTGTIQVTFTAATADRAWELRSQDRFVCRTPCTRWISPAESYQLRTEGGAALDTVAVPDLRPYAGQSNLEVRARPLSQGGFVGGIVTTGLGGGLAFIGGMLALGGAVGDRRGLLVAGGVTSAIGLVAVAPGVYLIATSGARAEVLGGAPAGSGATIGTDRGLGMRCNF